MGLIGTDTTVSLPKKVEINLIIPSFDEAYQLMLSNSPNLNILDKRVTSAKISVKQSWASSLPSLSMSLGYNATSSEQITKQYFEDNYIQSANLTLSIPLFNGFRKRNDIKISKLQLSNQQASYSSATKDAEVNLHSLLNRLSNYEELIPIEDLRLAQQKYELGSAAILELLDAQLAVIQASSSLVTTKYDAAIQLANLDNLIGTLDKKYK
jgi:outer membrane protein